MKTTETETYYKIAGEDLQDLGAQACPTREDLLQQPDQKRAERSADESAIRGHLGNARGEVVAVLVPVLGQP